MVGTAIYRHIRKLLPITHIILFFKILLQETLHKHNGYGSNGSTKEESIEELESAISHHKEEKTEVVERNSNKSLFKNWPLMSSIIAYCVFALHDMAYSEVCIT